MVTPVSFISMVVRITVTLKNIPKHGLLYWNTCNYFTQPSVIFLVSPWIIRVSFFSCIVTICPDFKTASPSLILRLFISLCTNAYIWGNLRYIVKIEDENRINVVNTHGDGQMRLFWDHVIRLPTALPSVMHGHRENAYIWPYIFIYNTIL